ncbi:exported hypothetical protein [Cupriavidus taiwanensis]|nr:exported hypothetical protein [Cupriavidus taiwanensis]
MTIHDRWPKPFRSLAIAGTAGITTVWSSAASRMHSTMPPITRITARWSCAGRADARLGDGETADAVGPAEAGEDMGKHKAAAMCGESNVKGRESRPGTARGGRDAGAGGLIQRTHNYMRPTNIVLAEDRDGRQDPRAALLPCRESKGQSRPQQGGPASGGCKR